MVTELSRDWKLPVWYLAHLGKWCSLLGERAVWQKEVRESQEKVRQVCSKSQGAVSNPQWSNFSNDGDTSICQKLSVPLLHDGEIHHFPLLYFHLSEDREILLVFITIILSFIAVYFHKETLLFIYLAASRLIATCRIFCCGTQIL